jgi:hypothetical protein
MRMPDAAAECAPRTGCPLALNVVKSAQGTWSPPPRSRPEHPSTRRPGGANARRPWGAGTVTRDEPGWSAPSHGEHALGRCRHAVHLGYWAIPTRHGGWRHSGQASRAGWAGWAAKSGRSSRSSRSGQTGQAITGERQACRAEPGGLRRACPAGRADRQCRVGQRLCMRFRCKAHGGRFRGHSCGSLGRTMERVRPGEGGEGRAGSGGWDGRARVVPRATASPLFEGIPDLGWQDPWASGPGDHRTSGPVDPGAVERETGNGKRLSGRCDFLREKRIWAGRGKVGSFTPP